MISGRKNLIFCGFTALILTTASCDPSLDAAPPRLPPLADPEATRAERSAAPNAPGEELSNGFCWSLNAPEDCLNAGCAPLRYAEWALDGAGCTHSEVKLGCFRHLPDQNYNGYGALFVHDGSEEGAPAAIQIEQVNLLNPDLWLSCYDDDTDPICRCYQRDLFSGEGKAHDLD